jgi:hypothetical protein
MSFQWTGSWMQREPYSYSPPQSLLHAISLSSGNNGFLMLSYRYLKFHPSSSKKVHIAFLSDSIIQTTQLADKSLPHGDMVYQNKVSIEF